DDVELGEPDVIRRAVELARRYPSAAIIGFRQLEPTGEPWGEQPVHVAGPCCTGRFFSYACLGRTEAIRTVGGFPHMFDYYYEEIELGIRLLDADHSILFDPHLEVIHHYDPRGRNMARIHRLSLRNACFSAIMRYPAWLIPATLFNYYLNYTRL